MQEEILKNKLNLIATNLEKLARNFPETFEEFQKSDLILSASERYFQLIVDTIIDCNQILIEENNLPVSDTYFNTFVILSKTSIFRDGLLDQLSNCVGTRNAIVHRYENIQLKREYEDIKKYIPLFKKYLKIIINKIQLS